MKDLKVYVLFDPHRNVFFCGNNWNPAAILDGKNIDQNLARVMSLCGFNIKSAWGWTDESGTITTYNDPRDIYRQVRLLLRKVSKRLYNGGYCKTNNHGDIIPDDILWDVVFKNYEIVEFDFRNPGSKKVIPWRDAMPRNVTKLNWNI